MEEANPKLKKKKKKKLFTRNTALGCFMHGKTYCVWLFYTFDFICTTVQFVLSKINIWYIWKY